MQNTITLKLGLNFGDSPTSPKTYWVQIICQIKTNLSQNRHFFEVHIVVITYSWRELAYKETNMFKQIRCFITT
jgi:hypothetical protein